MAPTLILIVVLLYILTASVQASKDILILTKCYCSTPNHHMTAPWDITSSAGYFFSVSYESRKDRRSYEVNTTCHHNHASLQQNPCLNAHLLHKPTESGADSELPLGRPPGWMMFGEDIVDRAVCDEGFCYNFHTTKHGTMKDTYSLRGQTKHWPFYIYLPKKDRSWQFIEAEESGVTTTCRNFCREEVKGLP